MCQPTNAICVIGRERLSVASDIPQSFNDVIVHKCVLHINHGRAAASFELDSEKLSPHKFRTPAARIPPSVSGLGPSHFLGRS
jgi:hypothetical protein